MIEEIIKWIPVDQQLPDDEMTVMVCHPTLNEPVWFGYHEESNWYTPDGCWLETAVTHWAEMPAGVEAK